MSGTPPQSPRSEPDPSSHAPVLCKYLGVPLKSVYGVQYGDPVKGEKLVGPFFSLGAAIRYYRGEKNAGRLTLSKYTQYMVNICEQLGVDLITQYKPLFKYVDTQGEPRAEKKYTTKEILDSDKLTKIDRVLDTYQSPPVEALETHGGELTWAEWKKQDPTYGPFDEMAISVLTYLERKAQDQEKRKKNKQERPRNQYSLYYIGFDKKKSDVEEVVRIELDNSYFQTFIKSKSLHTRARLALNGRCARIIWSSGQNKNNRARRLLFPQSKKDDPNFQIKGTCFVLCCGEESDLRLQGMLQITPNWTPIIDTGDKPKDDAMEDGEDSSDSDSDSDSESVPVVNPSSTPLPPITGVKRPYNRKPKDAPKKLKE